MHETRRDKNTKYLSDIYDTPRWHKEVAGEPGSQLQRIVYQICIDAFPWTGRKHAVIYAFNCLCLVQYCIYFNPNRQQFEYIWMLPNRQQFEYIWILTVNNLNPNRQQFEYI